MAGQAQRPQGRGPLPYREDLRKSAGVRKPLGGLRLGCSGASARPRFHFLRSQLARRVLGSEESLINYHLVEEALLQLLSPNAFFDCVGADEAVDVDIPSLADAMTPAGRSALRTH